MQGTFFPKSVGTTKNPLVNSGPPEYGRTQVYSKEIWVEEEFSHEEFITTPKSLRSVTQERMGPTLSGETSLGRGARVSSHVSPGG